MNVIRFSLFALISITILFVSCTDNTDDEKIKPVFRDISELVYASVKVVSKDAYHSRSSKSGIIQNIYVKEGSTVRKGDHLFKVKATANSSNQLHSANINLNEAKENLNGSNSKLQSIKLDMQRIREQNLVDSSNYQRRKRLWEQNIGSKNEFEQSQLVYQTSASQLHVKQLEYQQVRLNLRSKYEKAKNQVKTEKYLLGDLAISSQIDGIVLTLFKEVGEYISPQENFASIGSANNFILNINIDEVDISKIEIGDTAIINLEAHPNQVYTSVLTYIANNKDESTQTFHVEATFTHKPLKLFNGLSGEANILVARRKDAIVVPSQYLLDKNKVLTEEGSLDVIIGVKNLEYVEILSGIDTTTTLLKPDIQ